MIFFKFLNIVTITPEGFGFSSQKDLNLILKFVKKKKKKKSYQPRKMPMMPPMPLKSCPSSSGMESNERGDTKEIAGNHPLTRGI